VDYGAALEMRFAATRRGFESLPLRHPAQQRTNEKPAEPEGPGGFESRMRGRSYQTETPYALSAGMTGWKNVVPPDLQSPLPPEVSPRAAVPS
jgi:hypothetical protein